MEMIVEAAVSKSLPMEVLLGTDVCELLDMLKGNGNTDEAMVVMTRDRVQKREEEANTRQREMKLDIQLNNLQDSSEKLQEVLENVTQ